jgi:hypothetical protein
MKALHASGQLDFANGGWCMHDEGAVRSPPRGWRGERGVYECVCVCGNGCASFFSDVSLCQELFVWGRCGAALCVAHAMVVHGGGASHEGCLWIARAVVFRRLLFLIVGAPPDPLRGHGGPNHARPPVP